MEKKLYLRGDAAFATPDIYEYLEDKGVLNAIRPSPSGARLLCGLRKVGRGFPHCGALRRLAFIATIIVLSDIKTAPMAGVRRMPTG